MRCWLPIFLVARHPFTADRLLGLVIARSRDVLSRSERRHWPTAQSQRRIARRITRPNGGKQHNTRARLRGMPARAAVNSLRIPRSRFLMLRIFRRPKCEFFGKNAASYTLGGSFRLAVSTGFPKTTCFQGYSPPENSATPKLSLRACISSQAFRSCRDRLDSLKLFCRGA